MQFWINTEQTSADRNIAFITELMVYKILLYSTTHFPTTGSYTLMNQSRECILILLAFDRKTKLFCL